MTPQIEREERSRGVSWSTGMLDAITLKLYKKKLTQQLSREDSKTVNNSNINPDLA